MSGCSSIGGHILNPIARHKLGRKATKKKLALEQLSNERPQSNEISHDPLPPGIVDREATSYVAAAATQQIDDGVFRSSEWDNTIKKIMTSLKDDRVKVIGLHGMGGVGKSTMITEVYDQVKKHGLFDEVANVEVKVKPEIRRMQEEIGEALGLKFESESPAIRADLLRKRLLQINDNQRKKTVLIILDDLWEKLDLQEVGIPLGGNDQVQIKLLLTSRHEYLLSDKMGARNPIHLNVLSDADALRMFTFVVGVGAEGVKADMVNEISRKCSGLPIVIEATAKALKDRALDEWAKILKRLDNNDVLEKLKVSYDYLPSKESKELFLICGISRGPSIQVRDLLKYTFGLGLYEGREDIHNLADAGRELEELLSGLEAASMLLKRENNLYVNIHDHMRDLAVKIVGRDRLEWVHFTLRDDNYKLPRKFEAPKLELILSYCEEGGSLQAPESFFKEMNMLYVLEFTNYRASLPLSPDHLRNLATLCFNSCSLDDISMIGELKGLQILSFRGSNICKLPLQLRGLTALKMLDLSDCKKLTQIEPTVLGSLIKLEELNMENSFQDWKIEGAGDDAPSTNARLSELKNMTQLSNVRIHIPRASMLPKEGQLFSSKLNMYRIVFGDSKYYREFGDEHITFSRILILALDGSPSVLWQDWVQTTLQTTEVLYLSGCQDGKFKSISEVCTKEFECLKHLEMRNCPSFRYIVSSNDSSSTNLESLVLENLERLEKLCGGGLRRHEEAFSKLRIVMVKNCDKLTHLFDFSILKSRLSSQLEAITVTCCDEIQYIVVDEVGNNNNYEVVTLSNLQKLEFKFLQKFSSFCGGPLSNVLFIGKKVAFPRLESLIIDGLDELEHIWHPTDPPAELGNLLLLDIRECNKLVRVINSNVLMRLQRDLESLFIHDCGLMKEVFDVEEDDGIVSSSYTDDEHDPVLFSRLKQLRLCRNNNLKMMMKGGSWPMKIFPNIETLDVTDCSRVRYLLCCSLPTTAGIGGGYENIKEINIYNCVEMEAIVQQVMLKVVDQEKQPYSFSSLQKIDITWAPNLRKFCHYISSEEDSAADDLPFFSQKEIFPRLETLNFIGLKKLGEIWPREVPPQTSFNMLKQVAIQSCSALTVVFPSTLISLLENVTDISVSYCDEIREIIIVEEKRSSSHVVHSGGSNSRSVEEEATVEMMMFTFPCLKLLFLTGLPKLDRFCSSSSACDLHFPSLETVEIMSLEILFGQRHPKGLVDGIDHDSESDMAGALFTSCNRAALPNLKSITFEHCPSTRLLPDSPSFGNVLMELTVFSCNGLEYLLSPLVATSLVHLTSLEISECDNIKEVVVAVEEEEAAAAASNDNQGGTIIGRRDITFRHLKKLTLSELPRLEKFASVNNMLLNFPSLKELDIYECPNMTTFSSGIATSTPKFGDLNSYVVQERIL